VHKRQSPISLTASGTLAVLFCLGGASGAAAQSYYDMSCDQLWYQRNAIYAAKGYCFKTARAQQVFGPRCYPPYGSLTSAEESQVSQIRQAEAAKGCSDPAPAPGLAPAPAPAPGGGSCYDLWYQRNAIYAAKGYCFKTARARQVFGPRCYPPYGQLSAAESQQVAAIQQLERAQGCQ